MTEIVADSFFVSIRVSSKRRRLTAHIKPEGPFLFRLSDRAGNSPSVLSYEEMNRTYAVGGSPESSVTGVVSFFLRNRISATMIEPMLNASQSIPPTLTLQMS